MLGRLIAVFFVVLSLSSAWVAVFQTARSEDVLRHQAAQILGAEARGAAGELAKGQAARRAALEGLANSETFRAAVHGRDEARLQDVLDGLRRTAMFDHVVVSTTDGFRFPEAGPDFAGRLPVGGRVAHVLDDEAGGAHLVVSPPSRGGVRAVGSLRLDRAMATRLQRQGRWGMLLVVDGVVMGSTRDDLPHGTPAPGLQASESELGATPVEVGGASTLAAYAPVATATGRDVRVGVLFDEALASFEGDLLRDRLASVALLAALGLVLALLLLRLVVRPVSQLTLAATRIAEGDLDHEFGEVRGVGELEDLADALDAMVDTLRENTTTIRRQAHDLRRATERLVRARDDERRAMAATLHDGFQQRLVVLRMKLTASTDELGGERRRELADDVLELLTDLRRLSHDLYPSILRDRGLAAALHSLVGGVTADVTLHLDPEPFPRLPFEIESNAYFLASEGLTNALKHAPGTPAHVTARVFERELEVCVLDEGAGFDPATGRGAGIIGFEDRAAAVGGTCSITSDRNGTWIVARVPLPADPARPRSSREGLDARWVEMMQWQAMVDRGEVDLKAWHSRSALQEQQDGGDPAVEVRGV